MDFFQHQDDARRKTLLLIVLYVAGVTALLIIIAGIFLLVNLVFLMGQVPIEGLIVIEAFALLVVLSASFYRVRSLSGGGGVVAEGLGGRLLGWHTKNRAERVLLNVVEEMAIASGTPVPPVYVLDNDKTINAFAAGTSIENAVIGVTKGTIDKLNRDELQGVIAHEFSHIVNGDTAINIRIMGITFGLVVLIVAGYLILRFAPLAGVGGRSRGGKDNSGGIIILIIVLGVALIVLGFIGQWFSNLIRAAISRQREYLADAAAVQFTRNPLGIGGALSKILADSKRAEKLENRPKESKESKDIQRKYQEISHMLFITNFSTHPPLENRIDRIDASIPEIAAEAPSEAEAVTKSGASGARGKGRQQAGIPALGGGSIVEAIITAGILGQSGQTNTQHLQYARQIRQNLPDPLLDASHEPYSARSIIYALLLDEDAEIRERQLKRLADHASRDSYETTLTLIENLPKLDRAARLPLVEIALPALLQMTMEQYRTFKENVQYLVDADEKIHLSEWLLQRLALHQLKRVFDARSSRKQASRKLPKLTAECEAILSALAWTGHKNDKEATLAFVEGAKVLQMDIGLLPQDSNFVLLEDALETLGGVSPKDKRLFLQAAAAVLESDREVTVEESELYREIASTLQCPVPPMLPGQRLA